MKYKELSALAMEHSEALCYICDAQTYELLYLSPAAMKLCGLTEPADYEGKLCYLLMGGREEPCGACYMNRLKQGETYRWGFYNEKLGRWFDTTDTLLEYQGRKCRMGMMKDITARVTQSLVPGHYSMEDALYRCLHVLSGEGDFGIALNAFLETIGGYYQASRAYIFEFDLEEKTLDNTFEWCLPDVTPEMGHLKKLPWAFVKDWLMKFEEVGEFSIFAPGESGEERRILESRGVNGVMAAPLRRDGQIVGFLGIDNPQSNNGNLMLLRSVSEFVLAELEKRRLLAELEHMSYVDVLTGLHNRNYYNRILSQFNRDTPHTLGIAVFDINGLKAANTTHGHGYGDAIIKRVAATLQEQFPAYRIGGDEFAVLCTDMTKERFQEKLEALRNVFSAYQDCSISMGFSWAFHEDGVNVNGMIQQADEMRRAEKQSYYHKALQQGNSVSRTGFAGEVLQEIQDQRFMVYYQPQVNLRTGRVIGAEALVRKKAEDGSIIPPMKFLPFYEAGGVISHIDLFVMRTACATLRRWMEEDHALHISVNFSRVTLLKPDIVEVMREICAENQIPPSAVTVEVTESVGKMDNERLKELIGQLKATGFSISLDDFGSEYSNLAILAAMDFDEIKFDKSLVSSLEENEKSRVVMEGGMGLCRALRETTSLAEGIETKGQLDLLTEYRCDYGQGYYFSKPIPLDEFNVYLAKHT